MKKHLFIFAAVVVAFVACNKEQKNEGEEYSDILLRAVSSSTKTSLNADKSINWTVGDNLLVFRGSNYRNYFFYDWSGNEEGTSVILTPCTDGGEDPCTDELNGRYYHGTIAAAVGTIYAVYPFDAFYHPAEQYELSGTILTANANNYSNGFIHSDQALTVDSFAPNTNPALAISEDPDNLYFKNLASQMKFVLSGEFTVNSVRIQSNNSSVSLSGKGTVDLTEENPVATLAAPTVNKWNSRFINMVHALGIDVTSGKTFYVVVPAATITDGFTFKVVTSANYYLFKTTMNDITFNRSQIKDGGTIVLNNDYSAETKETKSLSGTGGISDYKGWGGEGSFSVAGTELTLVKQWTPIGWAVAYADKAKYKAVVVKFNSAAPAGTHMSIFFDGVGDRVDYDVAGATDVEIQFTKDLSGFGFENWSGANNLVVYIDSVQLLEK